jgi:hypothetical protein
MSAAVAAASIPQGSASKGYTPVGHEFFHLAGKVSGEAQMWCILYILRKTLGQERRRGTAPPQRVVITNEQFARMAKVSARAIESGVLTDAVERGLIARYDAKTHQAPGPNCRNFEYEALIANWKTAPPYKPKDVPKKPVASAEVDSVEVEETKEKHAPVSRSPVRYTVEPLRIVPRSGEKQVTLSEAVAVQKYQYENTSESAEALIEYDAGTLRIRVTDVSTYRTPLRNTNGISIEKNTTCEFSTSELLASRRAATEAEFQSYLTWKLGPDKLILHAGSAPSKELRKEIFAKLNHRPLAHFNDLIDLNRHRIKSPAFLRELAREAAEPENAEAWDAANAQSDEPQLMSYAEVMARTQNGKRAKP